MSDDKEAKLLEELFREPSSEEGCQIVSAGIENHTPSKYGIIITRIAAVFHYEDGSKYQIGPKAVNLKPGDGEVLFSQCTKKCCKIVYVGLTVKAPGKKPQDVPDKKEHKDKESCWSVVKFQLEIKESINQQELASDEDYHLEVISNRY